MFFKRFLVSLWMLGRRSVTIRVCPVFLDARCIATPSRVAHCDRFLSRRQAKQTSQNSQSVPSFIDFFPSSLVSSYAFPSFAAPNCCCILQPGTQEIPPPPQKNILYTWLIKVGRWGGLRLAKQELPNNTQTHTHKGQFQPDAYPTHLFFSAYPLVNINWPVTLRGMEGGGSIQYLLKIGILCERNTIQLLTNKGKQNTNVNGLSFDSVWLKSNQTNSFTQRTITPPPLPSQ